MAYVTWLVIMETPIAFNYFYRGIKVKHSAIFLSIFLGVLPGRPPSCNHENESVTESPCIAHDIALHPENYPELCGDSETAVTCAKVVPPFPSRTLLYPIPEVLIEVPEEMKNFTGKIEIGDSKEWLIQEIDQGLVLVQDVPDYYGIPIVKPFAILRSEATNPYSGNKMSLYLCVSDIREECIVDSVMILSWSIITKPDIFTTNFESAGKVFALRGTCPEEIRVNQVWKTTGELYLPEG